MHTMMLVYYSGCMLATQWYMVCMYGLFMLSATLLVIHLHDYVAQRNSPHIMWATYN